ncbi:MAG: hypothetical protein ABJA10_08915 [Aestuariivirga sp.]
MLKKLITVAAVSAAMFAGVAAMSGSAEARPWHRRHWHHGHMFMTPVYHPIHCVWRHRWHHGHRVNVRVCRTVY